MSIIEDIAELGIAKAVKGEADRRYKLVRKRIKRYVEQYPAFFEDGKPLPIVVNGTIVGSVSKTRRTVKHGLVLEHPAELAAWLREDGYNWLLHLLSCPRIVKPLLDELSSAIIADGEIPPGCDARDFDIEVDEGFRVNDCIYDDVREALGPTLPYRISALLDGEVEL